MNIIPAFLSHWLFPWLVLFIFTTPNLIAAVATVDHAPFADSLSNELYNNTNDCTSSLGISMVLSLVYPAAVGDAYTEMKNVLNYPDDNMQLVWDDTSTSLTSRYQGICHRERSGECTSQEPLLEIANSIWYDEDVVLGPAYDDIVGEFAKQLDFSDEDAGDTINVWVNESSNGLIDSIVDEGPLPPHWVLVAINSIYLKASWECQFEVDYTNEDIFYKDAMRTTPMDESARFMHQVSNFRYSHDVLQGIQLLQMPFEASGYSLSMIFALPTVDTSLLVSSVDVIAALPSMDMERVAVALPKFRFGSRYQNKLIQSLKNMGMVAPFSGGICTGACFFINTMIQKTVIDVNELGVEAAAISVVVLGKSMPPSAPRNAVLFQADHPFQFFIYDEVENVVIFEGRVGSPNATAESEAPLFASHSDADFWSTYFDTDASFTSAYTVAASSKLSVSSTSPKSAVMMRLGRVGIAVAFICSSLLAYLSL